MHGDGGHSYPPAPREPVPAVPPSGKPTGPLPLRGLGMPPITALGGFSKKTGDVTLIIIGS
jgi:hypothetical protein